MTVQEALNNILRATFGRDVRQSIHDGIKAANDVCEKTEQQQAEFENKMNEMVKDGEFTGTVEIGNVTTGLPGTEASVTNRGTKQHAILDITIPEGKTGKVENIDTVAVKFQQSETRANINTGETFSGIFGKIKKWFADLGEAAFYNVVNSDTVTESGFLPDARLLKAHKDTLNALQQRITNLESSVTALNSKLYPVGSIYLSVKSTNPSAFLGGTWIAWGTGRVPVGVNTADNNFNAVEKTGGANTHIHGTLGTVLSLSQIPAHKHSGYVNIPAHYHAAGNLGFYTVNNDSAGESVARRQVNLKSDTGIWAMTAKSQEDLSQASRTGLGGAVNNVPIYENNVGSGGSHNHGNTKSTSTLQPYITCYMWKRTA